MMRRQGRGMRVLLAVLMLGVVLPAAAWAGKKVTSGQQTLQIKAGLSTNRAGAQHVGSGTVVVNAAPTVSTPISGTVTVYNAVDNVGVGQPKGTRNLVLWIKTSIGVNQATAFRVIKGRREELQATLIKPSQPGVARGTYTIQSVTLATAGSGKRSFIINPSACRGNWQFALKVVNYFNQPPIAAHDAVRCRP